MRTSHKLAHTWLTTRLGRILTCALVVIAATSLIALQWGSALRAEKPDYTLTNVIRKAKTPGYLNQQNRHKLQVNDRQAADALIARGGRLLADYGTYKLVEVDTATAQRAQENADQELRDDSYLLKLKVGVIDTSRPEMQAARGGTFRASSAGSKGMWLIQFVGPVKPEWQKAVVETGVSVIDYIPNNAYLVYGDSPSLGRLRSLAVGADFVQWDGEYKDSYKMDPQFFADVKEGAGSQETFGRVKSGGGANVKESLRPTQPGGSEYIGVQLTKDASQNSVTIQAIQRFAGQNSIANQWQVLQFVDIIAKLPPGATAADIAKEIGGRPDVVSVAPYVVPVKMDERQDIIVTGNITANAPNPSNYLDYLAAQGFTQAQFTASNFAVNVSDSGIDNGTQNANHFALHTAGLLANPSRVIYNRLEGTPNTGSTIQGCDGHGNLNSHIIAGFIPTGLSGGIDFGAFPHADASGFRYGLGVAPFVKVGSSVIFDPDSFTFPDLVNLESKAFQDGSRISSNSWGANTGGGYNLNSQTFDAIVRDAQPTGSTFPLAGNQEYVVVFSAGNSGPSANTMGAPGTAKNVITVGASENVHPFGAADQCGTPDSEANSANDMVGFSSRGPVDDGRVKPDIVAPGSHVSGGVFQAAAVATGNGAASACFTALGVCAGPGTSNFWPLNQQFYTASSGTSHSAPAVAGAAALVRQRFINAGLSVPSPAMTKAALLNSAAYMNGAGANDNLFSNSQGMGLLHLTNFFNHFSTPSILKDQLSGNVFTGSGQSRVVSGVIADNTKPFRVTLAWTDPPGSTLVAGGGLVNNLDLEVTVGGTTFKGNVFTGAVSAAGGSADAVNNVEGVFIPAGVSGPFVVRVKATNIAGDGIPNSGTALDQDFALVIYNGNEVATVAVGGAGATVTAEDCLADGRIDPGETVTVNLCVQNVGTLSSGASVIGTLQTTGGVTNPSAAQNFGLLAAGGAAVCRSFTFRVSPSQICGNDVVASLQLQDGSTNLGTVTYIFPSGTKVVTLTEKFDGVTAPALPSGWTATNAVGPAPLWTTSTTSPDSVPNAAFVDGPAVISDKILETPAVAINSSSAQLTFRNNFILENTFDGGVLEASVNGAAYVDVTNAAVGGSFISGGYTATVSAGFSNPIGGRSAWTGSSGGYINSTVQFGPALNGKTVKFRFRVGTDTSVGNGIWRVDGVQVLGDLVCCTKITPVVTFTNEDSCNGPGNVLSVTTRITNPTAGTLNNGTYTAAFPSNLPGIIGSCISTVDGAPSGTCLITNSGLSWNGSLAGNKTVVIRFNVQIGDANAGDQLCINSTGGFTGIGLSPVTTCIPINCTPLGPGSIIPTLTSEGPAALSDQKPGSVLLYPVYTSSIDPNLQNTRISLTNVNPSATGYVHLFFVDGTSCSVADAFLCLTPNQTTTFLASDLDPGTTGYLVVIAVNSDGCPTNFNYLIGQEFVKFSSGHQASLGAEAIPALAGSLTACPGAFADVKFDGVNYGYVPRVLAVDNVGSRTDGNDPLIIINRIGGDLLTTASVITNLFGNLYDDQEIALSFSVSPRTCQFRSAVGNNFPRSSPRFEQFIPAGRSGWFKFGSTDDIGIFGAIINNNTNFAASGSAFKGGHNLHKLTLTSSAKYTIPVLPVSCQ